MTRNRFACIGLVLCCVLGQHVTRAQPPRPPQPPQPPGQPTAQDADELDVLIDQGHYRRAGPVTPRNLSAWRRYVLLRVRVDMQRGHVRYLRDDVLPEIERNEEAFLARLSRRLINDPGTIQARMETYRLLKKQYIQELDEAQEELNRRQDVLSAWSRNDGFGARRGSIGEPPKLAP